MSKRDAYPGVIVSLPVVLAAFLLTPLTMRAQLSEQDKALRARQNAQAFEVNASVFTFYDREGKQVGQNFGERALYGPAVLSPDRTRVATVRNDLDNESADLYVLDLASGKNTRLTTSKKTEFVQAPIWSPDGKQLAYVEIRDGVEGVYRRAADGGGSEELLFKNPSAFLNLSDWSQDGRYLSFAKSDLSGGTVYVLPLAEGEARQPREVFPSLGALQHVLGDDKRLVARAHDRGARLLGAHVLDEDMPRRDLYGLRLRCGIGAAGCRRRCRRLG